MECLLEINFRSIQDDMDSEDILDRFRDHFRDHFRSLSGFKIGFEHGSKSSLTSVLFLAPFWLRFGRPFGSKLATFSVPGGVPCGVLTLFCPHSLHFFDFISFRAFLEPCRTGFRTIFGTILGDFFMLRNYFWRLFPSCDERRLFHTQSHARLSCS